MRITTTPFSAGTQDPHSMQMPLGTPSSSTMPPMPMQSPPECESPYRYPPMYQPWPPDVGSPKPPMSHHPQQSHHSQHLMPPTPAPPIHHPASAFCALPPQVHNDPAGKYSLSLFVVCLSEFKKKERRTRAKPKLQQVCRNVKRSR